MSYTPKIEDLELMAKEAGVKHRDFGTLWTDYKNDLSREIWQPHLKLDHLKLVWEAACPKNIVIRKDAHGYWIVSVYDSREPYDGMGRDLTTAYYLATLKYLKEKSE